MKIPSSEYVLSLEFSCTELSSFCGLVDARIRAFDKYLPVHASSLFKLQTSPKASEKKWATRQSFIRKEITTYRIGTLTAVVVSQKIGQIWVSKLTSNNNRKLCFS